jgi:hypothetical protein
MDGIFILKIGAPVGGDLQKIRNENKKKPERSLKIEGFCMSGGAQ